MTNKGSMFCQVLANFASLAAEIHILWSTFSQMRLQCMALKQVRLEKIFLADQLTVFFSEQMSLNK